MSHPTELLSPFPAEPCGDSAENELTVTVTDMTRHEETYGLDSTHERALPPLWMTCGIWPTSTMD